MNQTAGRYSAVFLALVWLLTPLALLVIGFMLSVRVPVAQPIDTWVRAEAAPVTLSNPVDLLLKWEARPSLRAPSWNGIIQRVYVQEGAVLHSGDKVARVNGVDRIAANSPEPLWRPISLGDKGFDVEHLNGLLKELGFTHGDGSTADSLTVQGISELATHLGSEATRTFDPAWVLYLSSPDFTVEEVKIGVAESSPPVGVEVLTGSSILTSAVVVEKGSITEGAEPAQAQASPGGESAGSGTENLPDVGTPVPVPLGAELVSAGVLIKTLNDDKTGISTVDAAGLEVLRKQAQPGAPAVAATVGVPGSAGAVEVPGSALWSNGTGSRCVAVKQADGKPGVIAVKLLTGVGGRAVIEGLIGPGDEVLVSSKRDLPCT